MIDPASFADRVRTVFEPTPRGVVGLVDGLLELGRDRELLFEYRDGQCHIVPFDAAAQAPLAVPLQQSIFRAALARIAALCNEQRPGSVTPYRGEGGLPSATDPAATLCVAFTNLPSDQRLEIRSSASPAGESTATGGRKRLGVGPQAR